MSILNNRTLDGINIENLKRYSSKKVIKICDICFIQKEIAWADIMTTRLRHNDHTMDYCFDCSMKIFNSGDNNPSKRKDVKEKIFKKIKGLNRRKTPKCLEKLISNNGYILIWKDDKSERIPEHRYNMEKFIKKELNKNEKVHHIDGDKKNNRIENLLLLEDESSHQKLHKQLMSVAFDLVKKNIIKFDKITNQYRISDIIDLNFTELSLGFEDVAIKQKENICKSRLDVDISSEVINGIKIKIPMIASNMSTVVNSDFIIKLEKLGSLGIMHRASNEDHIIEEIKKIKQNCEYVASSIGIGDKEYELCKKMINAGSNIITIDVAHGFNKEVADIALKIKRNFSDIKVIVGCINNPEFIYKYELYKYIDAIRVGIAQGFACETKNTAGCTEKQFSSVLKFKQLSRDFNIPIISDGGIREPADLVKCIGAGANSTMCGKIFAECPESAAELEMVNDIPKKVYAGMASKYVQKKWEGRERKPGTCYEGGVRYLDVGESIEDMLEKYSGALRSGITYSGGKDIKSFQDIVEFVKFK